MDFRAQWDDLEGHSRHRELLVRVTSVRPRRAGAGRSLDRQSRAPPPPSGTRGGPESAQKVGRGAAANRGAQGPQPVQSPPPIGLPPRYVSRGRGYDWPHYLVLLRAERSAQVRFVLAGWGAPAAVRPGIARAGDSAQARRGCAVRWARRACAPVRSGPGPRPRAGLEKPEARGRRPATPRRTCAHALPPGGSGAPLGEPWRGGAGRVLPGPARLAPSSGAPRERTRFSV